MRVKGDVVRLPIESEPPVKGRAAWYRVRAWTTCPHLAARWARRDGGVVELWGEHRGRMLGVERV